ncbi:MAG: hypothetical protein GY928_02945 [Colwellia sp.]|nr:hypothetical protein [Colwellia sp.]
MKISLIERLKVWLKPNKIHKLKLTNSFLVLFIAFLKILTGNRIRGDKTLKLEESFKERFDSKYAIIFPHARTAVHYVLKSMDLKEGDEVLMTPLAIADMINSIHTLGLRPVFVDIEPDTYNFDLEELKKSITPRSRVLFVTYVFGLVPDMKRIQEIAIEYDLTIIEDCSQCFDALYYGQSIGTFGETSIFSLTNFKVCSSLFGGMITTNNDEIYQKLYNFRDNELLAPQPSILLKHSFKNLIYIIFFSKWFFSYFTYFIVLILENLDPKITYRLYSGNIKVLLGQNENNLLAKFPSDYLFDYTDAQAEVGLSSLGKADYITGERTRNGELLRELLGNIPNVKVPVKLDGAVNVYWRFPILSNDMEGLKKYLLDHGIDSAPTFLCLCSTEPGFEPYHKVTPNAERVKRDVLVLEVNDDLRENDIRLTAELVRSYFQEK